MLDFQLKQTTFRYGLAEGDDPHSVPLGVLMTLENFVWRKSARIEKRSGTDAYSRAIGTGGTSIAAAKRLFTRNSGKELCLIDGSSLYTYAPSTTSWTAVATVPDVGLIQTPLIDPIAGVLASDTAITGNMVVTAFIPGDPTDGAALGDNVYVVITNLATGSLMMPVTRIDGAATIQHGVRVIIVGGTAVITSVGATLASIRACSINLTTFVIAAGINLRNDRQIVALQNWSVKVTRGTSLFTVVYKNNAGGISLYSYNESLVQQATNTFAAAVTITNIGMDGTLGESLYVGYRDTTNLEYRMFIANPTTLAVTVVPFLVEPVVSSGQLVNTMVGVCRYDATSCIMAFTLTDFGATRAGSSVCSSNITNAGAITASSSRKTFGCALTSEPFMLNGKCYAFATNALVLGHAAASAPFTGASSVLLAMHPGSTLGAVTTHPIVAAVDTLLGADQGFQSLLPNFTPVSSTNLMGSLSFIGTAPSSRSTWRCALRLMKVTAGADVPVDLWRTVTRGPETFISCGIKSVYDGGDVFDYGFNYQPTLVRMITTTVGGFVADGNYIYASHLEYRGASGLLYRGPTTVSNVLVTTGGNVSINTLNWANVNVGNKKHLSVERFATSLPVYRTVVNGTIPQRLTEEPTFNLMPVTYANGTQIFSDNVPDAAIDSNNTTLGSRPALYTSGGTLDDQQCPANVTMFLHVDRFFVLTGDLKTWWYSKTFNDDIGVAPGYNVAFRIVMAEEQTAGASMDDKAVFFSKTGVSYMLGQGPAKDGTASDFTTPIKIQSDVGCTNARSVVSTPDGIMFQSAKGLFLLSRNLELIWIGKQVQNTLVLFPSITSATLVPKRNEVRFTCNNAAGTAGVVLAYNYIEKQWAVSKYRDTVGLVANTPFADACIWEDCWTFVTAAGVVFRESDTHYLDGATTYVVGLLETAWISSAGPLAYHAFRNFFLTGESHSDHDLRISIGFDSDYSTYPQTKLFPALSAVTSVGANEECKISVGKRRKCKSIRFKVEDTMPSTAGFSLGLGYGPSFEAMGVEVGVIPGDNTSARKKG